MGPAKEDPRRLILKPATMAVKNDRVSMLQGQSTIRLLYLMSTSVMKAGLPREYTRLAGEIKNEFLVSYPKNFHDLIGYFTFNLRRNPLISSTALSRRKH